MEAHNQAYGVKNYDDGVEFWFELDEKTEKLKICNCSPGKNMLK